MTVFTALLRRDLHVILRNFMTLLVANVLQQILLGIVFIIFLPRFHLVAESFAPTVLPGLFSVTILMTGFQGVFLPLWDDLNGSREVDERLLAPISVRGVTLEKIVAGTLTTSILTLVALPLLLFLVGGMVEVHPNWTAFFLIVILSSLVSAAFGITLGCLAGVRLGGVIFDIVIGPMILFGCAFFPWYLLRALHPLQYILLVNPLVFISEGLRFSLTPQLNHMPFPLILSGLLGFGSLLTMAAAWSFERRTIR